MVTAQRVLASPEVLGARLDGSSGSSWRTSRAWSLCQAAVAIDKQREPKPGGHCGSVGLGFDASSMDLPV